MGKEQHGRPDDQRLRQAHADETADIPDDVKRAIEREPQYRGTVTGGQWTREGHGTPSADRMPPGPARLDAPPKTDRASTASAAKGEGERDGTSPSKGEELGPARRPGHAVGHRDRIDKTR